MLAALRRQGCDQSHVAGAPGRHLILLVLASPHLSSGAPVDSVNTSNRATLNIKDSGLMPVLSIDCSNAGEVCLPVRVKEGNDGVTNAAFTVRLSGDPRGKTVMVDFEAAGMRATTGVDFHPSTGSLIFPPDVTTRTINVPANGDTFNESDETFKLVLKSPSNAAILSGDGGGDGVITDDDPLMLLTEEDSSERAIAFDSVSMLRAPFSPETMANLAVDKRTRIMLFTGNVELYPGEDISVVTAQAVDSLHRVHPLTVEYVGKVPGLDWLTQINVRLGDELTGAGDIRLNIALRGVISNQVIISLKPSRSAAP